MKNKLLLLFTIFLPLSTFAQFFLNGSAAQTSDDCVRLTTQTNFVVGSIWFEEKINLNESFDLSMELFLGCQDSNGADGIVFALQPISTSIGVSGGDIGIGGVSPSLAVEFDTWQNNSYSDPSFDHIAIIQNGILDHSLSSNLAGPIAASTQSSNIEDCNFHEMLVRWEADIQTFTVFFDCEERLSYTGDIINDIFSGDPEVFWGFTAATGAANNVQEICFGYSTVLNGFEDVTICPGGQFQLQVSGGESYNWSPTEGLNNNTIPNPIASPSETTTYIVEVLDECSIPLFDAITVFVEGDTVRFDIGNDTTICQPNILEISAENGTPATYLWSDGFTEANREVSSTGFYEVTVTLDDFCVTQADIFIEILAFPEVSLPPDTILCLDSELLLNADLGSASTNYQWSNGSTESSIIVQEADNYSVLVSNICGEVSASINVEITDCQSLYVPNAFSPNNDGINDVFQPYSDGDVQEIKTFDIYDRWGNHLFHKEGIVNDLADFGWDGFFREKAMQPAVYTWALVVLFRDGEEKVFLGDVTIIY